MGCYIWYSEEGRPQPAQALPRCTKCNSPPINGQCTNHCIVVSWFAALRFQTFNVPIIWSVTPCWPACLNGNVVKTGTHWRHGRKDVRHSGDRNYPLSTKSTEFNMLNCNDNVDRDTVDKVQRAGDSRLPRNRRQIGDKVDSRFVADLTPGCGDCRLCC